MELQKQMPDIKYETYVDIDYEVVGNQDQIVEIPPSMENKRIGIYYDTVYHDKENGVEKINSARTKAYLDRSRILFDKVRKIDKVIAGEQQEEEQDEKYMNVKARGIVSWNDSMDKTSYIRENVKGVRVVAK